MLNGPLEERILLYQALGYSIAKHYGITLKQLQSSLAEVTDDFQAKADSGPACVIRMPWVILRRKTSEQCQSSRFGLYGFWYILWNMALFTLGEP